MVVAAAAQQPSDTIEQIITAAVVPGLLALDATADLIHCGEPEPGAMEGVEQSSPRVAWIGIPTLPW
jgi:hypothetical protein